MGCLGSRLRPSGLDCVADMATRVLILALAAVTVAQAQIAYLRPVPPLTLPVPMVDGNSPGFWQDGRLRIYTSTGLPVSMSGVDLFSLQEDLPPTVEPADHYPLWIEAVWPDDDGTVYAWYHHEATQVCAGNGLAAPSIGALVSTDGGSSFRDLGIVLSSGDPPDCRAQNGFFAGGHGDFSVILDQNREYFYFLFTNYGGLASSQGVAIARMAFKDRASPVGAVAKFYLSDWSEPGLGGMLTPFLPAVVPWNRSNTDSFWGPAVHWNTYLNTYVVLLNRACCRTNWPQEGIYVTFNPDLSKPAAWTAPAKVLDDPHGYYPQAFGVVTGETDTLTGQPARLLIKGESKWEILFSEWATDPDSEWLRLGPSSRPAMDHRGPTPVSLDE